VGYYEPITQWSKGEYADANNTEDDLVVMQMIDGTARRGIALLVDDVTTPVDLGGGPGTVTRQHVIGSASDTDSFTFSTTGGTVTIDAAPAAVSPNLDLRLELRAGTSLVTWADPPSAGPDGNDVAVGLGATISAVLEAGIYTVIVDGVGFGDPRSDGYSDYASVGRYTLRVDISNDATGGGGDGGTGLDPSTLEAPTNPRAVAQADGSVIVTWTDNSTGETGFEIQREQQHKNGSWRGTTTLTAGSSAESLTDPAPGTGTFRYRIRAVTDLHASQYTDWVPVSVSGGSGGGNKGNKKTTAI
jgi:hypothetical protein